MLGLKEYSTTAQINEGFLDSFSFYCCDKYHYQKQHEKERVSDVLQLIVIERSQGKDSRRSLEAGTGTNTTKEHCLLGLLSWLVQPAFLYNSWPPAQGWHHSNELCSPTPINQENDPQLAYKSTWWGNSLIEFLSSQEALVCVWLTKTNTTSWKSYNNCTEKQKYSYHLLVDAKTRIREDDISKTTCLLWGMLEEPYMMSTNAATIYSGDGGMKYSFFDLCRYMELYTSLGNKTWVSVLSVVGQMKHKKWVIQGEIQQVTMIKNWYVTETFDSYNPGPQGLISWVFFSQ